MKNILRSLEPIEGLFTLFIIALRFLNHGLTIVQMWYFYSNGYSLEFKLLLFHYCIYRAFLIISNMTMNRHTKGVKQFWLCELLYIDYFQGLEEQKDGQFEFNNNSLLWVSARTSHFLNIVPLILSSYILSKNDDNHHLDNVWILYLAVGFGVFVMALTLTGRQIQCRVKKESVLWVVYHFLLNSSRILCYFTLNGNLFAFHPAFSCYFGVYLISIFYLGESLSDDKMMAYFWGQDFPWNRCFNEIKDVGGREEYSKNIRSQCLQYLFIVIFFIINLILYRGASNIQNIIIYASFAFMFFELFWNFVTLRLIRKVGEQLMITQISHVSMYGIFASIISHVKDFAKRIKNTDSNIPIVYAVSSPTENLQQQQLFITEALTELDYSRKNKTEFKFSFMTMSLTFKKDRESLFFSIENPNEQFQSNIQPLISEYLNVILDNSEIYNRKQTLTIESAKRLHQIQIQSALLTKLEMLNVMKVQQHHLIWPDLQAYFLGMIAYYKYEKILSPINPSLILYDLMEV